MIRIIFNIGNLNLAKMSFKINGGQQYIICCFAYAICNVKDNYNYNKRKVLHMLLCCLTWVNFNKVLYNFHIL